MEPPIKPSALFRARQTVPSSLINGWAGLLLPASVMESFKCSEIPPRGWQAILQKLSAALARSLEQLYVTS